MLDAANLKTKAEGSGHEYHGWRVAELLLRWQRQAEAQGGRELTPRIPVQPDQ